MDLRKAARDPWVWGQFALVSLVGTGAPLLPRCVNLGAIDFAVNRIDPAWLRWIGAGIMVLGVSLAAWGVRSLGRSLTPGTEPLPDAELATRGAYAYRRHPIYGGVVLLLTGYTLAWSNWTLALLVAAVTQAYLGAKAEVEERWLERRFPDYERYRQRVPRRVL